MQIADYIASVTGRSLSDLFMATPPLVALAQDSTGTIVITFWDTSLGAQPTTDEIAAALAAPLPVSTLTPRLIAAAAAAADALTRMILPTLTDAAELLNSAMMVTTAGGVAPTVEPYATAFSGIAAALGKNANDLATAIVVSQVQSAALVIAKNTLIRAAGAAATSDQLAAALTAFESSLATIVAALNPTLPQPISPPAAIVITGINA